MFFAYWSWDWIGAIFLSEHVSLALAVVVVTFCLVISIFSYTKIFRRLRQHLAQVQGNASDQAQPNEGGILLNTARYKKTVSSIAWVQLALVACYAPFVLVVILGSPNSEWRKTSDIIFSFVVTLVSLNSSLNPFLYCWKIKEVRQAVIDTIRKFCCLSV